MRNLFNLGNKIINVFWVILFGLTVFFAWTSVNIVLGDNEHFGTSTTMLTTGFVIGVLALVVCLVTYTRFRGLLRFIFVKHQLFTGSLLFLLIICWQIFFVTFVHPVSGFDAGMLHYAAVSPKHVLEVGVTAYYSLNQNNLPIMLLMRWIVVATGWTSWQAFDYITLFFVDLSAIFNLLSIFIIRRKALGVSIYLHVAWLAVFPSILMPYTDAWVLPLVSLMLLFYFMMRETNWPLFIRGFCALGVGSSVVLIYFMKPSSIIPAIAIVIIELLYWLIASHHFVKPNLILTIVALFLIGGSAGATYLVVNETIQSQDYIEIDKSRAIPMIHFMSMGVYGEGGYSEKQAIQMAVLPTSKQKSDYSKRVLIRQLKKLGVFGYLSFLVMKQRNNTADGTFGWLKEGNFFRENQKPKQNGISNQLKNYIFLYGVHIADFRFIAQFVWIIWLTLIALGSTSRNRIHQLLRVSMIGGFMFLLLFEGGRSRYLIQFLPCFLLLGSLSTQPAIDKIQKLYGWLHTSPIAEK